jgi:hypothetical protein
MIALLVGCAADDSGTGLNEFKGYPPGEPEQGSSTVDQIGVKAPGLGKAGLDGPGFNGQPSYGDDRPHFRDYAAYSWVDRGGGQWVSQTLLLLDGTTFFTRTCSVDARNGVRWTECDPWSPGLDIADLGVGFAAASGLGAFVFTDPATKRPTLIQTALSLNGAVRMGRSCPVDDKHVDLTSCSPWDKFEQLAVDLGVPGQPSFRDQDTYVFTDSTGQTQYVNRLLAGDGTQSWSQTCTSPTAVVEASKQCEFQAPIAVSELGIPNASFVSSFGGFVYEQAGRQIYAETAISMDGTKTGRRECLIDPVAKEIDRGKCSQWAYEPLDTVLKSGGGAL